MKITYYDTRNAKKLSKARNKPKNHRLSSRDWALIQKYARIISAVYPNARLVAFHARRKRFVWQCGNDLHIVRSKADCNWFCGYAMAA